VLGIPWDVDTEGLREYMTKFGPLDDCVVMKVCNYFTFIFSIHMPFSMCFCSLNYAASQFWKCLVFILFLSLMASDSCRFIFLLSDQPYFLSFDLKLSRLFWSPVFLNSDHLYLASILIHLHVCCIFKSIGAFFWPISWVWLCNILII
jgi:hypothetical protein